jgi:hypothetical protein
MSFSYYVNNPDTIDETVVAKVCPKQLQAFNDAVKAFEADEDNDAQTMREVASWVSSGSWQWLCEGSDDDTIKAMKSLVIPAYEKLVMAFEKKTGIKLYLGYADSDTMSGSDMDDEPYWAIFGHMQPTPAYKRFSKKYGEATSNVIITGG